MSGSGYIENQRKNVVSLHVPNIMSYSKVFKSYGFFLHDKKSIWVLFM